MNKKSKVSVFRNLHFTWKDKEQRLKTSIFDLGGDKYYRERNKTM